MNETVSNTLTGDESSVLPEFEAPPADPVALLDRWLTMARTRGVREPLAVTPATVDSLGHPASRIVLVKEVVNDALLFTTHTGSRKGTDLSITPWASMTFHWRETLQQIIAAGPVEPLPDDWSTKLFLERPIAAQATTVVSQQSQPLHNERALHDRAQQLIDAGAPLPRPPGWGGYRLVPHRIEFWQGRTSRLHRRLEYKLTDTIWSSQRLQP